MFKGKTDLLHDLSTGRSGDLGTRVQDQHLDFKAQGILSYDLGGMKVIVNLTAIR